MARVRPSSNQPTISRSVDVAALGTRFSNCVKKRYKKKYKTNPYLHKQYISVILNEVLFVIM